MPLTLICADCREPMVITDEMLEEAKELGIPFSPVHEKCPNKPEPKTRKFKVVVQVMEFVEGSNETWEKVAQFGGEYEGESFVATLPNLQTELNKGWEQVQNMAPVIDGEDPKAPAKPASGLILPS